MTMRRSLYKYELPFSGHLVHLLSDQISLDGSRDAPNVRRRQTAIGRIVGLQGVGVAESILADCGFVVLVKSFLPVRIKPSQ